MDSILWLLDHENKYVMSIFPAVVQEAHCLSPELHWDWGTDEGRHP